MTGATQPVRSRFRWRWLVDSPLVLAIWASLGMCLVALWNVAHALQKADRLRVRSGLVLAEVAAEAAITHLAEHMPEELPVAVKVGSVPVDIEATGNEWLVTATTAKNEQRKFLCPLLRGASPPALGRPLTVIDESLAEEIPGAAVGRMPQLAKDVAAQAWGAESLSAFRRDVGIALIHFSAGTELDDFVIDTNVPGLGLASDAHCVTVPGHLWIEPGNDAWRVTLEHDLTIIVQGNLYVGRPVVVQGPGRLVFVAQSSPTARGFADLDGSGRWSPGDRLCEGKTFEGVLEGGGNVYLGLAASTRAPDVGAGLVVTGVLHLRGVCRVAGPVALAHGIVALGEKEASLVTTGQRLFTPEREVVPGFAVTGPPRPGLLRPAVEKPRGREVLYLATPGR